MTAHTPVYGLEYIVEGEPLRNARPALENNAKTIEAALVAGGIAPPGASDLATLSGRVSTIEGQNLNTRVTALEVRRSGNVTVTTDAAGLCTVTHGLPVTPTWVGVTKRFTSDTVTSVLDLSVGSVTSTLLQVVAFRNDTHARLASTSISFFWEVRA